MFEPRGHAFVFQLDGDADACDMAGTTTALLDRFGEGRISIRLADSGEGFLGCIDGCSGEDAARLIEGMRDLSMASPDLVIHLGGWGSALPPTRMRSGTFELFSPIYDAFCQQYRGLRPASLERYS
ncbi:MAG: hypothetical protein VKO64_02745 [Candidatus Sericytochromatia bacterium]|nr:hypothetical protein [Candidatus Sericytochromatia bacterium]